MCAAAANMPYPRMVSDLILCNQEEKKEKGKKHEVSTATQLSWVFTAAFKEEEEEWGALERVVSQQTGGH